MNIVSILLYKNNVHIDDLNESDKLLWMAYDTDDILFFLTGQREHIPDFTEYVSFQQPISTTTICTTTSTCTTTAHYCSTGTGS
jgi:hypothetical protein